MPKQHTTQPRQMPMLPAMPLLPKPVSLDSVEAFMHRGNRGVAMSHRADVRDAFVRNYHPREPLAPRVARHGGEDAVHRTAAGDPRMSRRRARQSTATSPMRTAMWRGEECVSAS
jgi:hypothetical protein